MDEKELQEKFFWTTDEMERQLLLEANMPQFSAANYVQILGEYFPLKMGWLTVELEEIRNH